MTFISNLLCLLIYYINIPVIDIFDKIQAVFLLAVDFIFGGMPTLESMY